MRTEGATRSMTASPAFLLSALPAKHLLFKITALATLPSTSEAGTPLCDLVPLIPGHGSYLLPCSSPLLYQKLNLSSPSVKPVVLGFPKPTHDSDTHTHGYAASGRSLTGFLSDAQIVIHGPWPIQLLHAQSHAHPYPRPPGPWRSLTFASP